MGVASSMARSSLLSKFSINHLFPTFSILGGFLAATDGLADTLLQQGQNCGILPWAASLPLPMAWSAHGSSKIKTAGFDHSERLRFLRNTLREDTPAEKEHNAKIYTHKEEQAEIRTEVTRDFFCTRNRPCGQALQPHFVSGFALTADTLLEVLSAGFL